MNASINRAHFPELASRERASRHGTASPSTKLDERLAPVLALRAELLAHAIYTRVRGADDARLFMTHHVFAVWDFMSLLKALQIKLTSVTVPWLPRHDTRAARMINEIVLAEETDDDGEGGFISHYDLYLEAMREVGADVRAINRFTNALEVGASIERALEEARPPLAAREFVETTLDIAQHGTAHEVAAAFFLGREDIIPGMFSGLITSLETRGTLTTRRLRHYLARHVELDGDLHGPLAGRLLSSLCEDDEHKWIEARAAASRAISQRIALWDAVVTGLDQKQ